MYQVVMAFLVSVYLDFKLIQDNRQVMHLNQHLYNLLWVSSPLFTLSLTVMIRVLLSLKVFGE